MFARLYLGNMFFTFAYTTSSLAAVSVVCSAITLNILSSYQRKAIRSLPVRAQGLAALALRTIGANLRGVVCTRLATKLTS
jgi:hypothetical protein